MKRRHAGHQRTAAATGPKSLGHTRQQPHQRRHEHEHQREWDRDRQRQQKRRTERGRERRGTISRQSEGTYRSVFQSIDEGFCIIQVLFDAAGQANDYLFLEVNPAFEKHTGLTGAAGKTIRQMVPNQDAHWFATYGEVALTGEPKRFAIRGEALGRFYEVFAFRLGQPEERKVAVLFRDETARRQAELALRRSEERFRRALEVETVGVIFWDKDVRISDCNNAFLRMSGLNREEALGKSWRELTPPEFHAACERTIDEYLATGRTRPSEKQYFRKDGTRWWVLFGAEKLTEEEGVEFVVDISDRKEAEQALRQSQARLTQAVRVAGLGIFEHDHYTDAILFSPALRKLVGFTENEEVTIPAFIQKVVPEDRETLAAKIRQAHNPEGHGLFEVDYRVMDQAGEVRWVSARSQTFFEGEGQERRPALTIGAALDVTERKEAQGRLERLVAERTARLQELVAELEHFSYTITHDLKAPLRAMRSFAELATRVPGPNDAKPFLEKISTAAERMDNLIADALNYSRLVRQELPLEDVDTGALLRGILDSYPQFQPWRAQIRVQEPLPVVLGNEAGITQCFSNLLDNAVKFVKPGQMPEISVWAEHRAGWSRIWVEDKGIGIPREFQPRVFQMFARASKDYEGTGIGLALVRKVVHRMGGRVGVESEEGKGSRFWMELKAGTAPAIVEPALSNVSKTNSGIVLYVEDEEHDATFMRMAFEAMGAASSLRIVSDGRAAIDYLSGAGKYADRQQYPLPSVVLLDLSMRIVSGFEVLEWMRNHPDFGRTPVVVFSSSTLADDQQKARQLGANDFVSKPVSGLDFVRVVQLLREKWMPQTQAG